MSRSRSTSTRRQIEIRVWFGYQPDGSTIERRVTVYTGPTVADLTLAMLRAMRVRKAQTKDVRFSMVVSNVWAQLRSENKRLLVSAVAQEIKSLAGAHVDRFCSREDFLTHFTDRNIFTAPRDQVVYFYASRTAKEKRESALLNAFNRLPSKQQRHLLKALRVGPAIVVRASAIR